MDFAYLLNILIVILGFGFIIFWHELGHFLAARWVGVRVEQFAVGMGHAIVSYRKGIGVRAGNTRKEYDTATSGFYKDSGVIPTGPDGKLSEYQRGEAAKKLGISETEYRLSWIPIGGYVKPTGQDDLRPAAQVGADDPYAYGAKSVGKRMLIISAGVIMNVILAFALYVGLFLHGLNAPPPVVGQVLSGSPGQAVGLKPGDQILEIDGKTPHDFMKIVTDIALSPAGEAMPIKWRTPGGRVLAGDITPRSTSKRSMNLLAIGIQPASEMQVAPADDARVAKAQEMIDKHLADADLLLMHPGERIVAVGEAKVAPRTIPLNGQDVTIDPIELLDQAAQASAGGPVRLTVAQPGGADREISVQPQFVASFDGSVRVAGLVPRAMIVAVSPDSPAARAGVHAGDVVTRVRVDLETYTWPSVDELFTRLADAGARAVPVELTLLRGDATVSIKLKHDQSALRAVKLGGPKPLGLQLASDVDHPVVAQQLDDGPTAAPTAARASFTNTSATDGTNDGTRQAAAASAPADPPSAARPTDRNASTDPPSSPGQPASTTDASADLTRTRIATLNGQPIANWYDLNRVVRGLSPNQPVTVTGTTADGAAFTRRVEFSAAGINEAKLTRYALDLPLMDLNRDRRTSNPLTAAAWGAEETRYSLAQVYITLKRLVDGSVPASSLSGPLGIFRAGNNAVDRGGDWFIWFMALISANLAVVNFLPIPIVDGGLFIFLLIEKFTGKPPSPAVQSVAQVIGLILIASVFLFVTYHDIIRPA